MSNPEDIDLLRTIDEHENSLDLHPPDNGPNPNSNGANSRKVPKLETNHYVKIVDAFYVNKKRMVQVEIKFKPRPKHPDRDKQTYRVMISFYSITKKIAQDEIREKLQNQTPIQLFVANEAKYNKELMAKLQHYEDYERVTSEGTQKEVLTFSKPQTFQVDGVIYLVSGEVWRISSPLKKLNDDELAALPVVIDYTGQKIQFVDNEKKVINTLVSLIKRYVSMQPDSSNHGFFIAYTCKSLQNKLYTTLVKMYNQPVMYVSSGKQNGVNVVSCGKSLASLLNQLMTSGVYEAGGEFCGPQVFKLVKAGEEVFCDELHMTQRDTTKHVVAIVTGQYQGLTRMVGSGGKPQATVSFHSNKDPSTLKLPDEVIARLMWIYAGNTPMVQFPGYRKMMDDAKDIYENLPNILNLAADSFCKLIPDDRLVSMTEKYKNLAQDFFNLEQFHEKLQELSQKHGIEDLPECLQGQVDLRPYRTVQDAIAKNSGPQQSVENFLSALDIGDCWLSKYKGKSGIKIWVSGFKKCPSWVQEYALNRLPQSAQNSKRFRFQELEEDIVHPLVDQLKLQNPKFKNLRNSEVVSDSNESDDNEDSTDESDDNEDSWSTGKQIWRIEEDVKVLKTILNSNYIEQLTNDNLWRGIERKKVVEGHSWEEIKKRFFDVIALNLDKFVGLRSEQIAAIRKQIGITSDVSSGNSFNDKEVVPSALVTRETGVERRMDERQTDVESRMDERQSGEERRMDERQSGEERRMDERQSGEERRMDERQPGVESRMDARAPGAVDASETGEEGRMDITKNGESTTEARDDIGPDDLDTSGNYTAFNAVDSAEYLPDEFEFSVEKRPHETSGGEMQEDEPLKKKSKKEKYVSSNLVGNETAEIKYQCHCQRWFRTKRGLAVHSRTHKFDKK